MFWNWTLSWAGKPKRNPRKLPVKKLNNCKRINVVLTLVNSLKFFVFNEYTIIIIDENKRIIQA
ncbi:hypothetical protein GCM10011531_27500 [Aquaticitalea lipolytica]|uniref:Uncharacterized protein n=1 Tax=Aquaticitalea lipolytica TaxID=1247562 RepID=A0A8J2TU96_9FLAO|nr:hypothetical protein GCM10011531_27500 [Aquaticitalea lipolytica]